MSTEDFEDEEYQEEEFVPVCEKCWIDNNSFWEPESVSQDGKLVSRLIGVKVPMELSPEVNECYSCGEVTVVGIYTSNMDILQHYADIIDEEDDL